MAKAKAGSSKRITRQLTIRQSQRYADAIWESMKPEEKLDVLTQIMRRAVPPTTTAEERKAVSRIIKDTRTESSSIWEASHGTSDLDVRRSPPRGDTTPEDAAQIIKEGLTLVGKFRDCILRHEGKKAGWHGASVKVAGGLFVIAIGDAEPITVKTADLEMEELADPGFQKIRRAQKLNWKILNEKIGVLPQLDVVQQIEARANIEHTKEEICRQLYMLMDTYQRALGIPLPGDYSLDDVCA